jgi:hypothetical protein
LIGLKSAAEALHGGFDQFAPAIADSRPAWRIRLSTYLSKKERSVFLYHAISPIDSTH